VNVAVVGCGYVGLVSGVGLAAAGHTVVGIDADSARVSALCSGRAPFHEPGLDDALQSAVATGRFRPTSALADARGADIILLCVQTPPAPDGSVDLQFVEAAAQDVARVVSADTAPQVVAVRSTVPPGTADSVVAPHFSSLTNVSVASNPEFLREGSALDDFVHADRVVVGVRADFAANALQRLYAPLDTPVIVTTPPTAELAKYASNALLATLVSFSNQLARLAEATPDVDVEDALGILHRDRRLAVGTNGSVATAPIVTYLKSGCGFGGSCLPKDLAALIAYGRSRGEQVALLEAVDALNREQPQHLIALLEERVGGLQGRRVAVLGAAFKGGTDDLRESPALRIVDELCQRQAQVVVYDPLVEAGRLGELWPDVEVAPALEDAVAGCEACVVATLDGAWDCLPDVMAEQNGGPVLLVDGRRAIDPERVPAGSYAGIGRSRAR
jgi:UDPglucose 6-dehydrogenase/GDP-mannose 6-dehydrogenase